MRFGEESANYLFIERWKRNPLEEMFGTECWRMIWWQWGIKKLFSILTALRFNICMDSHNSQLNRVTFVQVWRPEEEEPFFRIEVNNKRAYDSFCGGKPSGGESFASTRPIPRKSSMTQLQLPYHTLPNLTREAGGSLCIYTWDWGRRLAWLIAN